MGSVFTKNIMLIFDILYEIERDWEMAFKEKANTTLLKTGNGI